MRQGQAEGPTLVDLVRWAEANRERCPICRFIADAQAGSGGGFTPVKVGHFVLGTDMQVLHLRGCIGRRAERRAVRL